MRVRLLLVLLLGIAAPAAWAQGDDAIAGAVPLANPALLPKSILALRGPQGDTAQLEIIYDRTRDGSATAPLTAWVGTDYFAVGQGSRLAITDLRLRRRFIVDRQQQSLANLSLYSAVMLRRVELIRRMGIAAALAKEGKQAKTNAKPAIPLSLDRFWIESELGIEAPGGNPAPLDQRQDGATVRFFHGGLNVASIGPGDAAIPPALRHAYAAFIHLTLPVHPRIAQWLGRGGAVPVSLDYISEARGTTERIALSLREAHILAADFPLPRTLSLVLVPSGTNDPDVALIRKILPRMIEAVGNRAIDRAGGIAAARRAIDRDFSGGRKFDAALRLTELALRWGRSATACDAATATPCLGKQRIDALLRDDPRSAAMFEATALQDHEPDRAIEIWQDLDRRDVAKAYVVDIFLGRLLSERGERVAAGQSFIAAFSGDPEIPTLYRELGDHFGRVSRLDLAWLCYDLGRALPDRNTPDALSGIDTVEQELATTYPALF
ncbi:MAG TPA: hypothetical protein VIJ42_14440 [Stellaceae bacterium]